MRKIISTISLICTISIGNIVGQHISTETYKKEVIHEEFNQAGNIFKIVTTTNNYFILDNGDYLLSRNNNESEYSIIAENSLVSDFVLKTSIKIGPSKNKKASIGIILKVQEDNKRAIVFEINKKGQYRIRHLQEDTDSEITDLKGNKRNNTWTRNKMINKEDKYNAIEIRTENNKYDIYVNSNFLTSFSFSEYTTGNCGLTISPSTKARISYYYINSKGEKTTVNSYSSNIHSSYQQSTTKDNLIQELNKKLEILKEENTELERLNIKEKSKKEKEIQILKSSINDLNISSNNKTDKLNTETISLKKELSKIQTINTKLAKDINENNSKNTIINAKLNKDISEFKTKIKSLEEEKSNLSSKLSLEIISLKKDLSTIKAINTKISQDLNKSNSKNTSINAKLNKNISDFKTKINSLEEEKSNLSSKLLLEINTHKKTQNELSKDITRKAGEIKAIKSQLNKIEKEVSTLRKVQSKHDITISNLEKNNANLHTEIGSLKSESTTLRQKITDLKATNTDLKNLFVLRDFEANNIKTSNLITKKNTSLANKEVIKQKKDTYSVQFGVYMTIQPDKKLSAFDNIWYEITQHGTYVYLSGQFQSPQEATTHKNILVSLGYPNAFVVTLKK